MPFKKVFLTEFDRAVYRAVLLIPMGQTRSYQWVAKKIGSPKSARAVGNSLNKNQFIPFIPCHRIIALDGSLGGYSGGIVKKIKLLEKEIAYKKAIKSEARISKFETMFK